MANDRIVVIQPMKQKPIEVPAPSSTFSPEPHLEPSTSVHETPVASSTHIEHPKQSSTPAEESHSKSLKKPSHKPDDKSTNAKPSYSPSYTLGSDSSHWGLTYSPYSANGDCKDGPSVAEGIASIASKGFSSIRLYSSDYFGPKHAGSVVKFIGLKLLLGVYISERGISDVKIQIHDITA